MFMGNFDLPVMFDLEQKRWCQGTVKYPNERYAGSTAAFRGKVYAFSVCFPDEDPDRDTCPSNVVTFDPDSNSFSAAPNTTNTEIYQQGSAVAGDRIYLVGGNAGLHSGSTNTEFFDGTSWTVGPSLNNEMILPAVVEVKGQLWAMGFIGHDTFSKAEYLDLKSPSKWQLGPILPFRTWFSGAVIDNTIYICEQSHNVYIGTGCAKLTIEDDGSFGNWTLTAPLSVPRWSHTIISYNQKLYVLGGHVPTSGWPFDPIPIVEEYDPKTDKWSVFDNSTPKNVADMPYGVLVNVPDSSFKCE